MGAASRPVWSAAGLDPIPGCVAAYNYSGSSNNNICSRAGVAIIILNPLFKSNISMIKCDRKGTVRNVPLPDLDLCMNFSVDWSFQNIS